jgi:serine/threonine protein kinase
MSLQFASLVVELEPPFSQVVDEYTKAKQDAVKAANLRKKRKEERAGKLQQAIDHKKDEDRKVEEAETARQVAEQSVKNEKEIFDKLLKTKYTDGLYTAHQHRYVPIPPAAGWVLSNLKVAIDIISNRQVLLSRGGESREGSGSPDRQERKQTSADFNLDNRIVLHDEFCPICLEKRHDLWYEAFFAGEKNRAKVFESELVEDMRKAETKITEQVEAEYEEYLYVTATETNFFTRKRSQTKEKKKKDAQHKRNRAAFIGGHQKKGKDGEESDDASEATEATDQPKEKHKHKRKHKDKDAENVDADAEKETGKDAHIDAAKGDETNANKDPSKDPSKDANKELSKDLNQSSLEGSSTETLPKVAPPPTIPSLDSEAANKSKSAKSGGISKKALSSRNETNVLTEALTVELLDELTHIERGTNKTLLADPVHFNDALQSVDFCSLPPRLTRSHLMRAARPNTPLPYLMTGLSLFAPDSGRCLIPEPEPEPEPDEDIGSVSVRSSEDDLEMDENGDPLHPPLGIRIRIWNMDQDNMIKGAFLGQVKIPYEDMMNPPKGFRAYPIQDDELCRLAYDRQAKEIPTGTLTVRVAHFAKDRETNEPTVWKLEIIRATGLLIIDKPSKTSNPLCEIFWKGPAEKHEKGLLFNKWLKVGETKYKHHTVDPVFERTDKTEYLLPPVWTDLEVDGRGPNGGYLVGGAWVSRNNIPNPAQLEKEKAKSSRLRGRRAGNGNSGLDANAEALSHADKLTGAANLAVTTEIQNRLEMTRLLWLAEERERKLMAAEEKNCRSVTIESLLLSVQGQLQEQIRLGRLYTVMLERMQDASMTLQKLRFHSGKALDSGGLRAVCRDQSTHKQYYVNVVPILYPEDEGELTRCCNELLGCQHPSLIRLLEYSAHQLRMFNVEGFPTINDRCVFAVFENMDEGILLPDFIRKRWNALDNEDLKCIFKQILSGLKYLHDHNIVHRNMHANCVKAFEITAKLATHSKHAETLDKSTKGINIYDLKSLKQASTSNVLTAKSRSSRDNKLIANVSMAHNCRPVRNNLICKVEDFWFLSNPRKPHCAYSLGRNDWGSGLTPPPEIVRGVGSVSPASDIYAFGMCVLEWASNSQTTLHGKGTYPSAKGIDALKAQIPLKWGGWVHDLIRQCLQMQPESRPTAQDLIDFLNDDYND